MAKSSGLNGIFRGKLASNVLYKLTGSNNKETQGVRAYVAQVANPKTEAQATQRMKMTAAVNFYRMLTQVLNNAFQSEKYGTANRQKFMSIAMSQTEGVPFVDRDDKAFYPGEYTVALGSLTPVTVTSVGTSVVTSLSISIDDITTFGDFSQSLINLNFGLLDGDRITLISAGANEQGYYVPAYSYFVLDTQNTEGYDSVFNASNIVVGEVDGHLSLVLSGAPAPVAAAVIVSRAPQNGSTTWLRSTSKMLCSSVYKANMMGIGRFNRAVQTYSKSASVLTSDWYLNLGLAGNTATGGDSQSGALTVVSYENQSVTISGATQLVAILTMSDGTKRAAKYSDYIAYRSGSGYAYKSTVAASAANLNLIKGVDAAVTGWYTVPSATLDSTPDEDRP